MCQLPGGFTSESVGLAGILKFSTGSGRPGSNAVTSFARNLAMPSLHLFQHQPSQLGFDCRVRRFSRIAERDRHVVIAFGQRDGKEKWFVARHIHVRVQQSAEGFKAVTALFVVTRRWLNHRLARSAGAEFKTIKRPPRVVTRGLYRRRLR